VKPQDTGRPAVQPEINPRPFLRGSLGLSSDGAGRGGLFICLAPQPLLDSRVTNFGRLISGDDLLDQITEETRILRMSAE
jgi:cyclophilin family peptidyl-prolyl cis-trans isomerase